MVPEDDIGTVNAAEASALAAIKSGRACIFEGGEAQRPVLRAELLEQACLDAPRGIRLTGARIEGPFDLSHATLAALVLEDCDIPGRLDVTGARLGRLSIKGSRFSHLLARGATIDGGLDFGLTRPFAGAAWIDAGRTTIRGGVDGCGAHLKSPPARPREEVLAWEHNYALRLSETEIQGNLVLNAVVSGSNPPRDKMFVADGGISLDDAHIKGSLWMRGVDLIAGEGDIYHPGDALHAHAAVIDGFMGLNFGFNAKGRVWLQGIKVRERLSIGVEYENVFTKVDELYDWGGRLMNQTVVLHLDQAEIGGSLGIGPVTLDGAVGMAYARVTHGLSFHGEIRNKSPDGQAVAINARGAQIGGDVSMSRGLHVEGKISFAAAKIGGQLNCSGASFDNQTASGDGVALDLRDAEIVRGVLPAALHQGDPAGATILGAVALSNASPKPAEVRQ